MFIRSSPCCRFVLAQKLSVLTYIQPKWQTAGADPGILERGGGGGRGLCHSPKRQGVWGPPEAVGFYMLTFLGFLVQF